MTTDLSRLRSVHELVTAAQTGDAHAMEDLIALLRPAVFRYCRSRLATYSGGLDAADDVAQETCMAVYKVVARYQDTGAPFTSLVYVIAANKIADAQRGFGRSAVLVDEFPDQTDSALGPEESALASAHLTAAHALINRLPTKMRDVLLLRADGVSAEQVAVQLSMSAGSVRVTHHRAIAKLRQLVDESEEHQELFAVA